MGMYLPNADFPNCCEHCRLYRTFPQNGNKWCDGLFRLLTDEEKAIAHLTRQSWCPLVELDDNNKYLFMIKGGGNNADT